MDALTWILSAILVAISAMHFYWGMGGLWPGTDEKTLANTVIGTRGRAAMPPAWLTNLVAVCIFVAALFPLMWRAQIPYTVPQNLIWLGMWLITIIFVGRGIGGYMPFFNKTNGAQPFADLNQKYYSPLCLAIGAGFASLLIFVGN